MKSECTDRLTTERQVVILFLQEDSIPKEAETIDRGNTKQEILAASLRLFSVQGFEATSISQIANVVGIRKASLYSHFESKQAILDALVREILEQYGNHPMSE